MDYGTCYACGHCELRNLCLKKQLAVNSLVAS